MAQWPDALTPEEMPQPNVESAFVDNNGHIWLFLPDPPSITGKWRIPGGVLVKPGNPVLAAALRKYDITRLTRLGKVRRKS